ncbi:MAG: V-type ATP synthase subunit E family protein, partial [Chitinophagales bacterium]
RRQTEAEERLLRRQALLEAKARLLGRVTAAAKDAVAALPDDQYLTFLVNLVVGAAPRGEAEVVLSGHDRSRFGARLVEEATRELSARGIDARLVLAPEAADLSGGVRLRGAAFEIDCSLERLLELAAEELEPDVARLLFA